MIVDDLDGSKPDGVVVPESDPRVQLLHRIAESSTFSRSPKLRDFLLYIGRMTLENRHEEIREHFIGERVFARRLDYNPGEDNIVRVEARQLRKRLEMFFATEGRDEPLLITIPKGAYVPCFVPRATVIAAAALQEIGTADSLAPEASEETAAPAANRPVTDAVRASRWLVAAVAVACLCTAAFVAGRREAAVDGSAVESAEAKTPIWASLFNDRSATTVICADSAWVLRQDILGRELQLSEYLDTNWNHPESGAPNSNERALQLLPFKQYTSIGDVHVVERLLLLNRNSWRRTTIKSARNTQLRDFKGKNAILLGSQRAIPWEELFEPQMNFLVRYDYGAHMPSVTNRAPRAGEQAVYRNGAEGSGPGREYSVLAYLPNLDRTGNVLMIAGSTMQSMEAAGDYFCDPTLNRELMKRLGAVPGKQPPYFEALLCSGIVAGDPLSSVLVSLRPIQTGGP